jgi:hypothetical protein
MSLALSESQRRAVQLACDYADRFTNPETGQVCVAHSGLPSERETVYAAITWLLMGESARVRQARDILAQMAPIREKFSICALLLVYYHARELLDDDLRRLVEESVREFIGDSEEDIIAGRNINIPLQTWTIRIAAGVMHERPDLVDAGVQALERLTGLVCDHGTIPEFNSVTYHPITLQMLRIIGLLGESRTQALAQRLERHLWACFAWRWHPQLRTHCGPWGRAYQDNLAGGIGNTLMLGDLVWGGWYDPQPAYQYEHAHDLNYGGVLALLADSILSTPPGCLAPGSADRMDKAVSVAGDPPDLPRIALEKALPVTVTAAAEQVDFKLGDVWAPGGVAELTTWMDQHLALATATRSHVHGMQNGTVLAQWSRRGQPVERLADFGQAYTRFTQNGRRPGTGHTYRNHQRGNVMAVGASLWADDGRPFALQSGPTALVLYVPKGQERRYVSRWEMFLAVPRLETVDAVYVDGQPVNQYEGPADGAVFIRSGQAALAVRFAACDPALSAPRLIVERSHDHLFAGLRLAEFGREREVPESEYRRYGGVIGIELRHMPDDRAAEALMADIQAAQLTDVWDMGPEPVALGGPREVAFRIGATRLYGRFAPVAETWLHRQATAPHAGEIMRLRLAD